MRAGGWMSCDACPCSRRTVRPACGCCPDTVVVADGAACLPTTAASPSGWTVLHRKGVAAAGTGADNGDVQECWGDVDSPARRYYSHAHSDDRRRRLLSASCASTTCHGAVDERSQAVVRTAIWQRVFDSPASWLLLSASWPAILPVIAMPSRRCLHTTSFHHWLLQSSSSATSQFTHRSLIAHLGKYSTLNHRKLLMCVYACLTVYLHSSLLPYAKENFGENSVQWAIYYVAHVHNKAVKEIASLSSVGS